MRYRPNIHVDGVSQCGEMNEYASENGKIVGDSEDMVERREFDDAF
jgi:hypothetical protein